MRTRRRRIRARLLIGAAVVVAALAVGGVAWARDGGSPAYRTAAVTRGSVTSTLSLSGTVMPVQSAEVGFAQSGTVASVDVKAGDTVTAGQTLAQLDLTSLTAKLSQARATEAAARQTLAEAEDGQLPSGGSGSGGSGPGGSAPGGSGSGSGGASSGSATAAAVKSAQQAVESAQQAVDQAQGAARSALSAAGSACDASGGSVADPAACLDAENAAMQAENTLATRQKTLTTAQSSLVTQVTKATTATSAAPASSTTTVTAVQLAQYQAALDADSAAVEVAQQNLDQGTAVSPLSGTVVSVGVTAGQSVSAGSSTQVIMISSPNGYAVDVSVPIAEVSSVKVGQRAAVAADGVTGTLAAKVTSISPTATSNGFAAVLALSGADGALRQGTSATVTLTTGSVSNAIVVPTSAVHTLGTRRVVEVLDGSTLQPAVVTTGVRGPLRTQVVSGLTVGQQVVLADLSSTVTSDSSTTTGSRAGLAGGGGFGGGGFGGGAGFAGRTGGGAVQRPGG